MLSPKSNHGWVNLAVAKASPLQLDDSEKITIPKGPNIIYHYHLVMTNIAMGNPPIWVVYMGNI